MISVAGLLPEVATGMARLSLRFLLPSNLGNVRPIWALSLGRIANRGRKQALDYSAGSKKREDFAGPSAPDARSRDSMRVRIRQNKTMDCIKRQT